MLVADSAQDLIAKLGRYPVDRYPVQHATTQFHLGSVLLHAGEIPPAVEALAVSRSVFVGAGMRLEAAKATVMLGVGLRAAGRLEEAAGAFHAAGAVLAELDQPVEQAAAAYNLGLVRHDAGDPDAAHAAWASARELFLSTGYPAQAAAAARDHGASLLTAGDVAAAVPLLEQSASLAERAGDGPGTAAAANVLGLAHLAAWDAPAAVAVLRRALGFTPAACVPPSTRWSRPTWRWPTSRLATTQSTARRAAGPGGAERRRCGARAGAAAAAAVAGAGARRPAERPRHRAAGAVGPLVREEVLRLAELPAGQRCVEVSGFLHGALARTEASYELVQSLLQVVLELPPRAYDLLVATIVDAADGRPQQDVERLRAVVGSAMARFAIPQWQRLAASLNAAAQATGQPATWR